MESYPNSTKNDVETDVQSNSKDKKSVSFSHPPGPSYKRPYGLLQNKQVREEIENLDSYTDCQRIVFLLKSYEFPSDITHSLELAIYHTYGSRPVAQLLDFTKEFENHGQKRYDDTYILIAQFMEAGWDNVLGRRALSRIMKAHSRFNIRNEDYLFVLWTFIDFPIQWMKDFGWRQFTSHEEKAWFHFWVEVGIKMGIQSIPETKVGYDAFVADYERREMVFSAQSRAVSEATLRIMEGWLHSSLRGLVAPLAACLSRSRFLAAAGYDRPHWFFVKIIHSLLKIRACVKRIISFDRFPDLLSNQKYRTYPRGLPEVEQLEPRYYSPLDRRVR
jgi:hypothetical protein